MRFIIFLADIAAVPSAVSQILRITDDTSLPSRHHHHHHLILLLLLH
jgi:hypothetical protein